MSTYSNNQAHLYGLHVLANNSDDTQGRTTWTQVAANKFPTNLDGARGGYDIVVLEQGYFFDNGTICGNEHTDDSDNDNDDKTNNDDKNNNIKQTIVVVLGGGLKHYKATNQVLFMDLSSSSSFVSPGKLSNERNVWHLGPSLNECRYDLASTHCGQYLYSCGGYDDLFKVLDTIECIRVSELFESNLKKNVTESSLPLASTTSSSSWTTLSAHLSEPRCGASAVTVPGDRFFLVIGGCSCDSCGSYLSSVDIVDTMMPSTGADNQNDVEPALVVAVLPGPNLQIPRCHVRVAILDNQVWAFGGERRVEGLQSIECLPLPEMGNINDNMDTRNLVSLFSLPWQLQEDLSPVIGQPDNGVTALAEHGCLFVAKRYKGNRHPLGANVVLVEVVDIRRRVVWHLPPMAHGLTGRYSCSLINIHSKGLLLYISDIGSWPGIMETLSYVELSLHGLKQNLIHQEEQCSTRENQQRLLAEKTTTTPNLDQKETLEVQHRSQEVQRFWNTLLLFYLFQRQRCHLLSYQLAENHTGK